MKKIKNYKELSKKRKDVLNNLVPNHIELSEIVYDAIANVIAKIDNKNAISIIKKLSTIKPYYKVQTIIDLFKEYVDYNSLLNEFSVLQKISDEQIDIFKVNNVLFY